MMRAFPALVLALSVACAGADSEDRGVRGADWTTRVDSAGDTIVVRTTGGSEAASAQSLVQEIAIGVEEGSEEYTFGQITEVEVGPAGEIHVFDRQVPALRVYDTAGRFIRTLGRKGGGPGEYEAANGVGVHRDGRVVLWDAGKASINVYAADGTSQTSWPVPGGGGFYTSNGLFTDTAGSTYIRTTIADPPKTGNAPQSRVFGTSGLVKWNREGVVVDSLAPPESPIQPTYITAQREGSMSRNSVPFAPGFSWTFSPHGYFVSARTDRYAVTLSRPQGKPIRIEREMEAVAVDDEERADAELIATAGMRMTDPTWRWSGPSIPTVKPFIRAISAGEDGRIWVSIARPGERVPEGERAAPPSVQVGEARRVPDPKWRQPLVYDVFEPSGRFLGRVSAPAKTTFRAMRGDHVWAVRRDSLDVEQVVRYRLTPGLGGRSR